MSIWFHIQTHKRYNILFETVEFEYRWRRINWRWSFCKSKTLTQIFIVNHICWLNANFWRYVGSRALPLLQLFNDSDNEIFLNFVLKKTRYIYFGSSSWIYIQNDYLESYRSNGAPAWSNDVRLIIFMCQQIQHLSTHHDQIIIV